MTEKNLKTVVLLGRPNVGKSTLFNRLIGRREAIETSIPGTTRDRLFGEVTWQNEKFSLVDIAGIEFGTKDEINKNIQEGIEIARESADLILFMVDWSEKDNEVDKRIARSLRKSEKPVILVVNKADNLDRIKKYDEFKRLGEFKIVPVSAISGKNSGDLLDEIAKILSEIKKEVIKEEIREKEFNLAIVGRPNAGKSTLLNSIIDQKRAVVSAQAGTTRDVLSAVFHKDNYKINLLDTAGIRRPGKIAKDTIESFALLRTEQAVRNCDVAVLLVDAIEGLVSRDLNIIGEAKELGKGLILAINKIDLWDEKEDEDRKIRMAKILGELQVKLNFMPYIPVIFISAENKENINSLLNQAVKVYQNRGTEISEEDLNQILTVAKDANSQLFNLTSLKQKKTNPPIFELKYKGRKPPHYTQIRYLENRIRDNFPMNGSPIFIDLSSRSSKRQKS